MSCIPGSLLPLRYLTSLLVLGIFGVVAPSYAASSDEHFKRESEIYRLFGELPRRGNLTEILECAGANEVLWTTAFKLDPRNREAHDAKRKAGWYAAVALHVFAVDAEAVRDAVSKAERQKQLSAVIALARRCRNAPDNWRE